MFIIFFKVTRKKIIGSNPKSNKRKEDKRKVTQGPFLFLACSVKMTVFLSEAVGLARSCELRNTPYSGLYGDVPPERVREICHLVILRGFS